MADICCGVVNESKTSAASCDHPSSRAARRRRMDIRRFKFVPDVAVESSVPENGIKRQKLEISSTTSVSFQRDYENGDKISGVYGTAPKINGITDHSCLKSNETTTKTISSNDQSLDPVSVQVEAKSFDRCPKFGMTAVCGRRRDMEDAVAIHPSFWRENRHISARLHFFGVYDGHGCSHVAMSCKDRLHHLVEEELEVNREESSIEWKETMEQSFSRMDKEVLERNNGLQSASCRCELQMPQCDAVGSTAVVSIVTSEKIIVANCGDSRAVLSRGGKAVPLSIDHKPDLPEELHRIQDAGGRVIYWDGPRVLGVLAMSRAIGDNYLKPYVSSEPQITVTERSSEDEFLIMASDGLWDVVSNDTACGIVRMCLNGKAASVLPERSSPTETGKDGGKLFGGEKTDKACSDAAMLLTKLALARRSSDNVSVVVVDLSRD